MAIRYDSIKPTWALCFIILPISLVSCKEASREIKRRQLNAESCEAFKKSVNPNALVDSDFKTGQKRFYFFNVIGFGTHNYVPGISVAADPTSDFYYDPKTGNSMDPRNSFRPLAHVNGMAEEGEDAPYEMTTCSQNWIDWGAAYNQRLCTNMRLSNALHCKALTQPDRPPY
jgi:hypothetical protein